MYQQMLSLLVGVLTVATSAAMSSDEKFSVRLVYAESFPEFCTTEDSSALFHMVSQALRHNQKVQHRQLLRSAEVVDPMDCSKECAWVNPGSCTVVKPWLAGPCNDWDDNNDRRSLKMATTFDSSFVDFQLQVMDDIVVIPKISDDKECTEAIMAARMALQNQKVLSTPCARNVFGKPIELECFRGYV